MKKSVYTHQSWGTGYSVDLEILCDLNRELTDTDHINMRNQVEALVKLLHGESIRLNPKSKEYAEKERAAIIELFGGREIFIEEIPNGYCSDYCCKHLPWFMVTTRKGRIKIGWRKRVINIDWSDSIIKETAQELFPEEDVTKTDKSIHAWGLAKAKAYIDILLL